MTKTTKSHQEIEAILASYLLEKTTYRQLDKKYDIDFRIKHSWFMKFKGNHKPTTK